MDTKILAIVLLIIGVVTLGSYYQFNPNEIEVEKIVEVCPEIAMLDVEYLGLYENLYDSSEMFFNYRVDNFGNQEAKNVKVNCKLWDRNDNQIVSVIDSIGNVASNSHYLGEVITDNIETDEEGALTCYIESCDNCKILMEEIPELWDYMLS